MFDVLFHMHEELMSELKALRFKIEEELESKKHKVIEDWNLRETDAKTKLLDYSSVVDLKKVEELRITNNAAFFLSKHENGPTILYTLLRDPDTALIFAVSNSDEQAKMLIKISQDLKKD